MPNNDLMRSLPWFPNSIVTLPRIFSVTTELKELFPNGNRELFPVVALSDRHSVLRILTKSLLHSSRFSLEGIILSTEQLFTYLICNVCNYSYFTMYITLINIYMETENENIGLELKCISFYLFYSSIFNFKHILLLIHNQAEKFRVWSLSM